MFLKVVIKDAKNGTVKLGDQYGIPVQSEVDTKWFNEISEELTNIGLPIKAKLSENCPKSCVINFNEFQNILENKGLSEDAKQVIRFANTYACME